MRWRFKDKVYKTKHLLGSVRTRILFAFLPIKMSDKTWVWLENYNSHEVYVRRWDGWIEYKNQWIVTGKVVKND